MKIKFAAPLTLLCLSYACAHRLSPPRSDARSCDADSLDLVKLQSSAGKAVVLIRSDRGVSGTGWIVTSDEGRFLNVVTNHHVIAGSQSLVIDLPTESGVPLTVSPVEVIRTDPAADLAILRAPRLVGLPEGLSPSPRALRLGESIAVLGFPGVAGSRQILTVERGDVTAIDRVFAGTHYVQTNANINPGNSGGPVLDACGAVVGVVVATVKSTERTKLFIPIEKLLPLLAAKAPTPPEPLVRARIEGFLSALAYGEALSATAFLAEVFVARRAEPAFAESVKSATQKVLAVQRELKTRGIELTQLSAERFHKVLEASLSPEELASYAIGLDLDDGKISEDEIGRVYFAAVSEAYFGRVKSHRIERIKIEDRAARAIVELASDRGTQTWIIDLVLEAGDWQLAGFSRS